MLERVRSTTFDLEAVRHPLRERLHPHAQPKSARAIEAPSARERNEQRLRSARSFAVIALIAAGLVAALMVVRRERHRIW
ncbi:hypothetical protein A7982_13239 [Minicystis rosea]|nr:hypothetical protein A7982_13239 [Minicystis rosea]